MTIDFTKPVQTVSGLPVRIICTDRKGEWPIIGIIADKDGSEDVHSWTNMGKFTNYSYLDSRDLMNVPETKIYYVNVYWNRVSVFHLSLPHAHSNINEWNGAEYICTLKLTYEDGVLVKKEIAE